MILVAAPRQDRYPDIHIPFIQPWVLDEEPAFEILKAAWDLGINTIDTANIYSNGESERLLAKFIQKVPRILSLWPYVLIVLASIRSPVTG